MKQRLLEEYHGDPPPVSILAAGMLSSSVAQFASYPLSLVRTRLQVGDAAVPDRLCCPDWGALMLHAAQTGPGILAADWPSSSSAAQFISCFLSLVLLRVNSAPAAVYRLLRHPA